VRAYGTKRERGAYFTPRPIAQLLADWAIRGKADVVLDPAAGRGDLLSAAISRLAHLGTSSFSDVWGVELHRRTHRRLVEDCVTLGARPKTLVRGDFFASLDALPPCDVILANPPYVRHHDVPQKALDAMRRQVAEAGVALDGKASTWAYFVLQATQKLKGGGRLAAVLPTELTETDYGREVLQAIRCRFESTSLIDCESGVFKPLQLRVLLLLANGYTQTIHDLGTLRRGKLHANGNGDIPSNFGAVAWDRAGANKGLHTRRAGHTEIVREIENAGGAERLESLAKIGIGYVTGDTSYFHLTEPRRKALRIPVAHVTPTVHRGRLLEASLFWEEDWRNLRDAGAPCWLLAPGEKRPRAVSAFLRWGARQGVSRRSKCAAREPWWRVPLGPLPDAFLVYLGSRPRIVCNKARAHASNSLYVLSLTQPLHADALAIASLTSVFQVSAMLECRQFGGGLRRLEVSDSNRLLTPVGGVDPTAAKVIDGCVRRGEWAKASSLADEALLNEALQWPRSLIRTIQTTRRRLESARWLS
jgi:adenine-specific DNA-methyltransferase